MEDTSIRRTETETNNTSRPSTRGDRCYGKLVLLRDTIKDVESDANQLREFVNSISNEVYVNNEKIKSLLEGNQKRLDLLRDLNHKIAIAEYKRTCYIEEFIDLVPFPLLRDYYNGFLNVNNNN